MKLNNYDIQYDTSILNWDEALPLGNGKLGALIYGDGPLRVAIDRVDLWDNRPNPKIFAPEYNYETLVKLSLSDKAEDWKKREEIFEGFGKLAYPTNITAGRLELDFGKKTENIRSKVDIEKAIAEVDIDDGFAKVTAFMSATRFVGAMRIYGDFDFTIHIPEYISGDENGCCYVKSDPYAPAVNRCLAYPRAEIIREGEFTYYQQKTHTDYEYGVVVLKKVYDGYSELYFTVATNDDDKEYIAFAKEQLFKSAAFGFDGLKQEHIAWWKTYWAKSEIQIGDALLEKTYYRSWYLFASCSRKGFSPMSLQGVWIADNDGIPPWKGDYHYDTNVQLSYQAYLKANRLPEGEVLIDYLWDLRDEFKKFAKEFFGVGGLILPGTTSLDGKAMGGWPQYSLSPTMSIWAAQSFDEYYLYTGDKKFLKERAYPYFRDIGKAIKGLLKEKNGKLYLPLSTSPEIYDNTKKAYLKGNSNFDLALLIYLFKTLQTYARILGKNKEAQGYEKIVNKLDDIGVEGRHILLDTEQPTFSSHRHFSHLMCLYPLHLINYDTEEHKRLYEGSLWDIEFHGTGLWVGYSYGMCAQIYAMAQKGNAAYEKLRQFARAYVAENGFHLNGDFKGYGYSCIQYRPFTLEASFAYCDALHETLMQDHQGYIHLFPAAPQEWNEKEISFKSLRSRNGVLVSANYKKGKTLKASFSVKRKTEILLKNTFEVEELLLKKGKNIQVLAAEDGYFRITLQRGTTVLKRR
ncbi:MAG: glycoside hydrolase N-terminal domain-containing protein [Clostridia bacterium]|nr:glycoside hydrolase N-terminal domain-containing protein [Clostridia bacterium]